MQGVTWLENKKYCPANPHWDTRFKRYTFADDLADDLCGIFRDAEGLLMRSKLVKNSRSTTAGIFVVDGKKYFIERSSVNTLSSRLRQIGRVPRSTRNMFTERKISELNILTPRVYMSLETGHELLPAASYLIMEAFPEQMSFEKDLADLLEHFGSVEALAQTVCLMVLKIHCAGITHGDLKMSNLLAVKAADGKLLTGLYDFNSTLFHGSSCPEKLIIKDLAQMAASFCRTANRKNIINESNIAENLIIWSKAYAAAGGADYSRNVLFMNAVQDFMRNCNMQE